MNDVLPRNPLDNPTVAPRARTSRNPAAILLAGAAVPVH
jgi:hypothetical protein